MEEEKKYTYDGRFEGNISIVGQAECGKQKLTRNLYGKLKKIEWISEIELDKNIEAEMEYFYDSNNVNQRF